MALAIAVGGWDNGQVLKLECDEIIR